MFLIESAVVVLLVIFLLTEVIWPLLRGRPCFPTLGRRGRAERKLKRIHDDLEIEELERAVSPNAAAPGMQSSGGILR